MQRIAFYLTSFEGGGAERNTVLIASEMARRGHPVLVIVDRETGPNRALLEDSVDVVVLGSGYRAHVSGLRRNLSDWRADVVFARLGLCPIIATLAAPRGCKVIISYHNPYDPKTSLGVRLSWRGVALLSRLSHATFGVSGDITTQLKRFGARSSRCHTIPNPAAIEWIDARKTAPLPEAFPTSRPFLLAVGRFVPQKGYPNLIAAYARIANDIEQDLVILGEGPLEQELRAQVAAAGLEDRIHFAGYAENPFPIYAAARLFVLASQFEGFGNVIVEALACGTPVVATNCPGGPKDILDHGKYGTLVPVGDPPALATAIVAALATSANPQANMARASDYALTHITDRYIDLVSPRKVDPK